MKVYALISANDDMIEGIYTTEGKRVREKKLLEDAQIGRIKHIETLENLRNEYISKVIYFHAEVANLARTGYTVHNVYELLDKLDALEAKRKTISDTIDSINQMSAAEVLKVYGIPYSWEERELIGD